VRRQLRSDQMEDMMSRKWIGGVALAGALALPVLGWAHGGHAHKVMGTVSSVQGNQVEIKGTDGKSVVVTLNSKTAITRGRTKLDVTALTTGERVSIDYTQDKSVNTATAVKLGTAPAAGAAR
jgi:hypothetical protein